MSNSRDRSNSPNNRQQKIEPQQQHQSIGTHVCICTHTSRVPRPRNAFILYRQHHHSIVVAENPGKTNPEISKIIGEQWRSLPQKEKEFWIHLGDEEKKSHLERFPDYRYQPRRSSKRNSSTQSNSSQQHQNANSNDSGICSVCKGITPAGLNQTINNNKNNINDTNNSPHRSGQHPRSQSSQHQYQPPPQQFSYPQHYYSQFPPPPPHHASSSSSSSSSRPSSIYFDDIKHSSTSSSSSSFSGGSSFSSRSTSSVSIPSRSSIDSVHHPHPHHHHPPSALSQQHQPSSLSGLPRIIPRPQDELPQQQQQQQQNSPSQHNSPATPPPGSQGLAWPFNYYAPAPQSPHDSPPPKANSPHSSQSGFYHPPPPPPPPHAHPPPVAGPLSTVQEEELRSKKRRMSSHYDPVSQVPQSASRNERYQSAVALVSNTTTPPISHITPITTPPPQQQPPQQHQELSVREKADVLSTVCEPANGLASGNNNISPVGKIIAVEGKDQDMVKRLSNLLSDRLQSINNNSIITDGLYSSPIITRDQPVHLSHPAAINMWKIAWLHQLIADLPHKNANYTVLGGYLMGITDDLAIQDPLLPKIDNRPPPSSQGHSKNNSTSSPVVIPSTQSSPGLSTLSASDNTTLNLGPRPASTGGETSNNTGDIFSSSSTNQGGGLDYRHQWMTSVNMLKGLPAPDLLVYVQSAGLTQAEVAVAELKSGMKMLVLGGNKDLEEKLVDKIYEVVVQQLK